MIGFSNPSHDLATHLDGVSRLSAPVRRLRWWQMAAPPVVTVVLLCLGVANIRMRATWREVEDGVLWAAQPQGVVAQEIAAGTPAQEVGLAPGDVLLAIDGEPVQQVDDVIRALHRGRAGTELRYTVVRLGAREVIDLRLAPIPNGPAALYFFMAAVGVFTLVVGAAVRMRRPRDPATLHFFWLAVAFFGVFTFSFSGRLDRLDWVFYWSDVVSILLLPPLFLHFSLVFPDQPSRPMSAWKTRVLLPLVYAPALVLGVVRAVMLRRSGDAALFTQVIGAVDRLEYLYLSVCLIAGLTLLVKALREARAVTARRQLRWIAWGTALGGAPFALGYALPYALGVEPSLPMRLSVIPLGAIPLAYACAIVRYRLMDVEVIVKRALVYAAALSAIVAIYAVLLQLVGKVFLKGDEHTWVIALLATLVAVLLAPPVKENVQNFFDRAFYRDRYDYRRALVGFARDLNSDLDLNRLAGRLVSRVTETLLVERMALMVTEEGKGRFASIRAAGFGNEAPPPLRHRSTIGRRVASGETIVLDDPMAVGRLAAEEIEFWRDAGLYYFIPCASNEGTIALLALGRRESGEPLSSEDMALLAAVAGQIATALENARLYHQLHLKAAELDRMREFNENILESLDDGLLVVDLDDRIVRWNSALEQILGRAADAAIGRQLDEVFDASFLDAMRAARRDSPYGATLSRVPLAIAGQDAPRARLVNAAVVPLRSADSEASGTLGTIIIVEDITSRAQLEEQLQISEKMASIGVLAAGVAHEVNTPLTGISSFTQMLLDGADPEDPRTQVLEKIERQTFRAAKIVNSLLNLSRHASSGSGERGTVDINAIIGDVLSLLEHQLEIGSIKVRRDLTSEPALVIGAEHKLQQVFLNLFLNARDAMPKGGWLSVSTRHEDGQVIAEVADTGSGIPPEHLARIYDPFFTTKTMGQGTGLGLSITYGIVREHEGSLMCESTVGQGTRFTVGVPMARAESNARVAQ
jgi:two-component system, NtrC family, sensor kinase